MMQTFDASDLRRIAEYLRIAERDLQATAAATAATAAGPLTQRLHDAATDAAALRMRVLRAARLTTN